MAIDVGCLVGIGGCGRTGRVLFDDLALDEATPFPQIARRRRLICSACRMRSFEISPDWRDHVASGNGRVRKR